MVVGVTAALGPGAVAEVAAPVRAAASVVVVGLLGVGIRHRYGGLLDRSVDAWLDRPARSLPYGLAAFGLVGLLGAFGRGRLHRVVDAWTAAVVAGAAVALVWLALAGLGFAVVGTLVADAWGTRDPWAGPAVGALLSGSVWLVPSVGVGAALWVAVSAAGVGGATRRWLHDERTGGVDLSE